MVGRPSSVCTSWTVTIPGHTLPRRREAVSWMKSSHSQEEPPALRRADHSSETGTPATSVIAYAAKSNLFRLSGIPGLSARTLRPRRYWNRAFKRYSALLGSLIAVPETSNRVTVYLSETAQPASKVVRQGSLVVAGIGSRDLTTWTKNQATFSTHCGPSLRGALTKVETG